MQDGEEQLVVSDTSPLLNLALIDQLSLLETQFSSVVVPQQVWDELVEGEAGVPELEALRERDFISVDSVDVDAVFVELRYKLDRGEAAAIAYAIKADADLVIIDEREGRKAARRHNLAVIGVIGICIRAAIDGDIALQETLDALRNEGFWISDDLYQEALQRVKESADDS